MLELSIRRIKHEPLQYILEEWYFRDLTLLVKKPTLIPRIETEQIIDIVKNELNEMQQQQLEQSNKNDQYSFLEIGTGTGAISISILKECGNSIQSGIGIDIQQSCVSLTQFNLNTCLSDFEEQKNKYQLLKCSFEDFAIQNKQDNLFDFIVSNPPYISTHDYNNLEKSVKKYEDKVALESGPDGLDLIRQIIVQGCTLLKLTGFMVLEIDSQQPKLIRDFYNYSEYNLGEYYLTPIFIKDCFDVNRFVLLKRKQ